jgi:hypothetical protein
MNTGGAFGYDELKRMELREFYTLIMELNIYNSEQNKQTEEDQTEAQQMSRAMNDPAIRVVR